MAIDIQLTLLPFFLLLLPLLLFLIKNFFQKQSKNLPPNPPKLPFIGNLHQLGSLPHQSLCQLSKKYGSVMLLHLGNVPTVIVSSAEAARQVLKIHDLDSCSRPSLQGARRMTYNFQDVAFTPYGEYWREIRKICVLELFSLKRVLSYRSIREEEVAKLIGSISNHSSSSPGAPVDLTEKLFALTASIIFRTAFGTTFQGSDFAHEKFHEVVLETEATMGSFCAAEYFPYVGWIVDKLSGLEKRRERIFHELDHFFQSVIDDHNSPGRTKQANEDIIDVLLKIVKEQTGFGATLLTESNIKAVLLNMFLGGVDTAAITMVWAMAELAKKPELMKKAQDEVRTCIGNEGKVSESNTDQLLYLKMIKKTKKLPKNQKLTFQSAMAATNPNSESNKLKPSVSLRNSDELKKVFDRFDTNGDGKISVAELDAVLKALGTSVSSKDLHQVMEDLDSDHDGFISLEEFAVFYNQGSDDGAPELRDAFDLYDQDHNGLISAAELHQVLTRLGMNCAVDDCNRMIRSVDSDGDGNVNFEEFRKMMTHTMPNGANNDNNSLAFGNH